MADDTTTSNGAQDEGAPPTAAPPGRRPRRSAGRPAGPPQPLFSASSAPQPAPAIAPDGADGADEDDAGPVGRGADRAVADGGRDEVAPGDGGTDAGSADEASPPAGPAGAPQRSPSAAALVFQPPAAEPRRRRGASRPAGAPEPVVAPPAPARAQTPTQRAQQEGAAQEQGSPPAEGAPRRRSGRSRAAAQTPAEQTPPEQAPTEQASTEQPPAGQRPSRARAGGREDAAGASSAATDQTAADQGAETVPAPGGEQEAAPARAPRRRRGGGGSGGGGEDTAAPTSRRLSSGALAPADDAPAPAPGSTDADADADEQGEAPAPSAEQTAARIRSPFDVDLGDELDRLRGRGEDRAPGGRDALDAIELPVRTDGGDGEAEDAGEDEDGSAPRSRRRRGGRGRRRRSGSEGGDGSGGEGDDGEQQDGDGAGVSAGDGPHGPSEASEDAPGQDADGDEPGEDEGGASRRRRRGRGRGGRSSSEDQDPAPTGGGEGADDASGDAGEDGDGEGQDGSGSGRRRRRGKRSAGTGGQAQGSGGGSGEDDVTAIKGSTRLEAKRQRRREGRETGRRPKVVSEAEFLARRESVERTMVVRSVDGRTQVAVLEDGVLVEHYVARKQHVSMIGDVHLGKVQNVLPSMEAAFVDIGRGRNAVLYAGEVNWEAAGLTGQSKRIESALRSGDPVLVQVSKDPVGHKGARLTSQVSLPGRYLVYVPGGSMTGISRKLPDTERSRLKKILKEVVPADGGVIVRTAAEGASETELKRDVERLVGEWERISARAKKVSAPTMLHGEPDLTIKVVRDVFNEDFARLVVDGDEAWGEIKPYVDAIAPDLSERVSRWEGPDVSAFASYRVDEQIAKALERKVWLPSGGSLVIDRTEAMTVVDVNTGRFTGSGGNLEETVTRNNLEAAEEIVRQLRLRDIGGIVVVDFIDMVLESNRDLVLRRLVECLGRDRTKHQVAEVTSLGLVQMTRKRVGQGLLEAFSEPCQTCHGSGVLLHDEPLEPSANGGGSHGGGGNGGGGRGRQRRDGRDGREGRTEETEEVDDAERTRLEAARDAVRDAIHGVAVASRLAVPHAEAPEEPVAPDPEPAADTEPGTDGDTDTGPADGSGAGDQGPADDGDRP